MTDDTNLLRLVEPTDDYHKYDVCRGERAKREPMLIVPVIEDEGTAGHDYYIFSASGSTYHANPNDTWCDCPDMENHQPDAGCYHVQRVQMELMEGRVPAPGEYALDYLTGPLADTVTALMNETLGQFVRDEATNDDHENLLAAIRPHLRHSRVDVLG